MRLQCRSMMVVRVDGVFRAHPAVTPSRLHRSGGIARFHLHVGRQLLSLSLASWCMNGISGFQIRLVQILLQARIVFFQLDQCRILFGTVADQLGISRPQLVSVQIDRLLEI